MDAGLVINAKLLIAILLNHTKEYCKNKCSIVDNNYSQYSITLVLSHLNSDVVIEELVSTLYNEYKF